ncbi:MAG TPA: MFS transporter [Micromonosporaceae bacterium]|jgi:MFS family permease
MTFTSGSGGLAASRWRDVYIASAARGISVCGDFLAATALVLAVQAAGGGGFAISALLLAASVPLVVLAPLTGRLADRADSRTLLVGAGLGQAAVCTALAFTSHQVLTVVLVALLAAGLAVTQPTIAALLPAMVRRADLPRASALNQTAGSLGVLIGPALAGVLVGEFGPRLPRLLAAAGYLAVVAAGFALRTHRGRRTVSDAAPASGVAPVATPGWRLWGDPLLRAMVVSVAAVIAAVGAINVVEVFFVRDTLHASMTVYGLIGASWTGGMLAGAWLLARRVRRVRGDGGLVWGVLLMLGACCAAVSASATAGAVGWLFPLWIIGGVFNGGMNTFSAVVMGTRVPEVMRGRAFATLNASVQGAAMFGYLVGGALVGHVPTRLLVAALGLAGMLVVAVLVPSVLRAARREQRVATEAPEAMLATVPAVG